MDQRTPAQQILRAKEYLTVAADPAALNDQIRVMPAVYFDIAMLKAQVDAQIATLKGQQAQTKNLLTAAEARVWRDCRGQTNPATGKPFSEKDMEKGEEGLDPEIQSLIRDLGETGVEIGKQEAVSKMYYDLLVALKDASDICQRIYGNQAVERAMASRT